MGLIRKSLYLGTGGVVAPHSRKQRVAMKQLAALQGRGEAEVRRAGGRSDFAGFWDASQAGKGVPPAPRKRKPAGPAPSEEDLRRRAWELHEQGIRPAAIAINLSVDVSAVRKYLSEGLR